VADGGARRREKGGGWRLSRVRESRLRRSGRAPGTLVGTGWGEVGGTSRGAAALESSAQRAVGDVEALKLAAALFLPELDLGSRPTGEDWGGNVAGASRSLHSFTCLLCRSETGRRGLDTAAPSRPSGLILSASWATCDRRGLGLAIQPTQGRHLDVRLVKHQKTVNNVRFQDGRAVVCSSFV